MVSIHVKTIWHYAFAFFKTKEELGEARNQVSMVFYSGRLDNLGYLKAAKIAQLHPNYWEYYEKMMMPLFQGKGKLTRGTESPVMALESYKTKKESETHLPYILIWKIIED